MDLAPARASRRGSSPSSSWGRSSALFISQNRRRVKVDFVLFDRFARTWVVILIAMGLGALLAELVRATVKRRRKTRP